MPVLTKDAQGKWEFADVSSSGGKYIIRNYRPRIERYRGGGSKGILERMSQWAEGLLSDKLPLHVEKVKIYPDKTSLLTLQFTERLGYRQENAFDMLTMGCYDTSYAMGNDLEAMKPQDRDAKDRAALELTRNGMSDQVWPDKQATEGREALRNTWQCTRKEDCLFYALPCLHGAKMGQHVGQPRADQPV